jgi:hypothetical protein
VSPMHIDHLMRVGVLFELISAADLILHPILGDDEDPQIVSLAEQVKSLMEVFPDDVVQEELDRFYNSIPRKLVEDVKAQVRKPEPRRPFWDSIKNAFWRTHGGDNLYPQGWEQAAKKAGADPRQTKEANNKFSQIAEELRIQQENWDTAARNRDITPEEWLAHHKLGAMQWQAAMLALGMAYPQGAQFVIPRKDYQAFLDSVNTISGMIPDRRTKAEILNAAFRAITPQEIQGYESIFDMETFYRQRDEFIASLSQEDRTLLKEERQADMTAFERQWERDLPQTGYEGC